MLAAVDDGLPMYWYEMGVACTNISIQDFSCCHFVRVESVLFSGERRGFLPVFFASYSLHLVLCFFAFFSRSSLVKRHRPQTTAITRVVKLKTAPLFP